MDPVYFRLPILVSNILAQRSPCRGMMACISVLQEGVTGGWVLMELQQRRIRPHYMHERCNRYRSMPETETQHSTTTVALTSFSIGSRGGGEFVSVCGPSSPSTAAKWEYATIHCTTV